MLQHTWVCYLLTFCMCCACVLGCALQAAAAQKGQEVRELNHMLKAWEAMRLGKDAQVCHPQWCCQVVAGY
jgi:hypothetical protein